MSKNPHHRAKLTRRYCIVESFSAGQVIGFRSTRHIKIKRTVVRLLQKAGPPIFPLIPSTGAFSPPKHKKGFL